MATQLCFSSQPKNVTKLLNKCIMYMLRETSKLSAAKLLQHPWKTYMLYHIGILQLLQKMDVRSHTFDNPDASCIVISVLYMCYLMKIEIC